MKALILAAGEGVRLRPYTLDRPKCMVELREVPLLRRQLEVLRQNGICDITILTGYRAEHIESLGYPTCRNANYATTNMVATLMCAREQFDGSDDVLILYGDIVYESFVLATLCANQSELATTVDRKWNRLWSLRNENPLDDAETLKVDSHGNITELGKKATSYADIQAQFMGLIKVRSDFAPRLMEIYDSLDPNELYEGRDIKNMYTTTFLQHVIDSGFPVRAVAVDGGWLEVDTVADLELFNSLPLKTLNEICRLS